MKGPLVTVTIGQLAELVQGTVVGDGKLAIRTAQPLNEAGAADITFVDSEKYLAKFEASSAAAAVVARQLTSKKTVIQVADPLAAFVTIVQHLQGPPRPAPCGIDARADVHATAVLGAGCSVAAFASIGAGTVIGANCRIGPGVAIGNDCVLGDNVVVHAGAVLYDRTVLGSRVILHARVVLGADGFGYRFAHGVHAKVPQLGRVIVEDDVEIGAGTTIDRATFGTTRIGQGTKIDNLVQIGHNCHIGKHNLLIAQVGLGGSTTTGDYVVLAGQVGVAGHVHIGAGAQIGAQAGVHRDIPSGERWFGAPAMPESEMRRIVAITQRLPEMRADIRAIKAHLHLNEEEKAA